MTKLKTIYEPKGKAKEYAELAANLFETCEHACVYCLDGETLITKSDMSVTPIKNIQVGDVLIGIKSNGASANAMKFVETTVLGKWTTRKHAFEVELENGSKVKCSADHRWLTDRGWKRTIKKEHGRAREPRLTLNNRIRFLADVCITPSTTEMYMKGYIAGMIRGDGHLAIHGPYESMHIRKDRKNKLYKRRDMIHTFNLRLNDHEALKRTKEYLSYFGVKVNEFIVTEKLHGIRTSKISYYEKIKSLIVWNDDAEYARGFLSGICDAEGSFDGIIIRIHNSDSNIINDTIKSLDVFGFKHILETQEVSNNNSGYFSNKRMFSVRLKGGRNQIIKFWQIINPSIMHKRSIIGGTLKNNSKIVRIADLGYEDVMYDIQTSSENFIANGMISHNCYVPNVMHIKPEEFFTNAKARKGVIEKIIKDAEHLKAIGEQREILLCFTCDPYQSDAKIGMDTTKTALTVLFNKGLNVTVLTKGGNRSLRDIDLFETYKDQFRYGATLAFSNDNDSLFYEPFAALTSERINALDIIHKRGIRTWISIEPAWSIEDSINIINRTHEIVDVYKIGKLNYHPHADEVDWAQYTKTVVKRLKELNKEFYVKEDLREYL